MLNKLTEKLYAEGFTQESHPNYVYWSDYENFGYKWETLKDMVWITGCGLLVHGLTVATSDVSYNGEWYCPENGNPVFRCPRGRTDCPYQAGGALAKYAMCACHRTDLAYDYEASAEKAEREIDEKKQKAYREITGGQYCINVVSGNGYEAGYYEVRFDPQNCINYGCKNEVCSITKKPRDLSKCNIFYDIVREWKTRIGLIEDTKTAVEKGVKVFSKPVARTDAELWLARKKSSYNPFLEKTILNPHLTQEDRRMEFFSKHHRQWPGYDYFEFNYRVQNIRIAKSEQRDLLQDLQDVENGIEVFHASDAIKEEKAKKQDAKQKREEEKARKLRKSHLNAFEAHWDDPVWERPLRNWLGDEYESMIERKREEQSGIGQQLSLF